MRDLIIETKRLFLVPWKIEDADAMQQILNDETIANMLGTPFPYTLEMAQSFIKNIKNRTKDYFEWKIVLKDNNEIIGGTALDLGSNPINLTHIYISKDFRNMGYGTEVWNAKIKFCFENTETDELICAFNYDNNASRRMQEKCGMTASENINENNQITTSILRKDYINDSSILKHIK
jgi:RimJ/RimL family protein N-acetyltransferase